MTTNERIKRAKELTESVVIMLESISNNPTPSVIVVREALDNIRHANALIQRVEQTLSGVKEPEVG